MQSTALEPEAAARPAMSGVPFGSQVFGWALHEYPGWALRFARVLRLGACSWALWAGASLGSGA